MRPVARTSCSSSSPVDLAEDDGADGVLVEVEGQAQVPSSNSSSSLTAALGSP